jgi:hypothetical protein
MPASPVSVNRSRSTSFGCSTCTSAASTGSVGAKTAPRITAAPSGNPSQNHPSSATSATVSAMEANAKAKGSRQRRERSGRRSFNPAAKSDTTTAISVAISSKRLCPSGSRLTQPSVPTPQPIARYNIAMLIGRRLKAPLATTSTMSSMPIRTYQRALSTIRSGTQAMWAPFFRKHSKGIGNARQGGLA